MQDEDFINEIEKLNDTLERFIQNKNLINDKQKERLLKEIEKSRYNLFEKVKLENKYLGGKIDFVNNNYKAKVDNSKIYLKIPEVLPKYKNINNFSYKNIMLNVMEATKKYKGFFENKICFVIIIVHENQENYDIDNKYIKPIIDRSCFI